MTSRITDGLVSLLFWGIFNSDHNGTFRGISTSDATATEISVIRNAMITLRHLFFRIYDYCANNFPNWCFTAAMPELTTLESLVGESRRQPFS
jgi:hypothetical protein